MKTNLILLCLMMLLFSCAKGVKTKAVFSLKSLSNLSTEVQSISQNGLVIFGYNNNGHRFSKVLGTTDSFDHELDNGEWTIKAVSWQDSNSSPYSSGTADTEFFTGVPNCAITNITLNGAETEINLSLSNANCELGTFGGVLKSYDETTAYNAKRFNSLKNIFSCNESLTSVAFGDECKYDLKNYVATGDAGNVKRGYHSSFKIKVISAYIGPNNTSVGEGIIESNCIDINHTNGGLTPANELITDYQIPSGEGLQFIVDAYYEPGCPSTARKKPYFLTQGLGTSNTNIMFTNDSTTTNSQMLYLRSTPTEVCTSNIANPATNFAGGAGTNNNPYLICTPRHLNELYGTVGSPIPFSTNSFRLVKDIDMNLETEEFFPGQTYHVQMGHHIEPGKNFKPIGFDEGNRVATNGCTSNNPNPGFTGWFDGGKNTIKNLRMNAYISENTTEAEDEPCNYTGLFAKLSGGGAANPAIVARLNFENVEIENVASYAGVVAGYSTNSEIYEINVKNLDISGEQANTGIGGITGVFQHSVVGDFKKIKIENVRINVRKNENSNLTDVGGAVGKTLSTPIDEVIVKGEIIAEHEDVGNFEALHIGGVVGNLSGTTSRVAFYGSVEGSRFIGGIGGELSAGTHSDLFVKANIKGRPEISAECLNAYVGGISGDGGNNPTLNRVLFLGQVQFSTGICPDDGTTLMRAASISGEAGPSPILNDVFASNATAAIKTYYEVAGTNVTNTELRDNASTFSTSLVNANWIHVNGDYPRLLIDEGQACANADNLSSLTNQESSLGRGTSAANPITICTSGQLATIPNNTNKHYSLLESLIVDSSIFTSALGTFNGTLEGNNNGLHGLTHSFISTNNGVIKNISFHNYIDLSDTTNVSLINSNAGTLFNLKVSGNVLGSNIVGILTNINSGSGVISKLELSGSVESSNPSSSGIGLVSGINNGIISNAEVHGRIASLTSTSIKTGGIAGYNTGEISKVQVSAYLDIMGGTDINPSHYAGAITGDNLGNIHNVEIEGFEGQHMSGPIVNQLGYVAGENSGVISKVVAYHRSGDSDRIIGTESSGIYDPNEHYILDYSTDTCYGVTTACDSTTDTLKGLGWNIEDFVIPPGVINPIFINYYIAEINGTALPVAPNWERDGQRISLFGN